MWYSQMRGKRLVAILSTLLGLAIFLPTPSNATSQHSLTIVGNRRRQLCIYSCKPRQWLHHNITGRTSSQF